ncbi:MULTISPECIES: alpha/beta fold hydrolase [unclassified Kitasatospora]|uniref:alpha/beta fold hydrolase n=1 Tax=unclassified Kitasatospora TaxID=2633591 RepID=UPI0007093721|nr:MULTISPECIES: alpha/beta hydrolase [unclassified Kitasatospora]KQV20004.1 hydrolase [Kitasatospora sp. Root107]KRB71264.1 hydrolase [Kitasatospora sp. Root187]
MPMTVIETTAPARTELDLAGRRLSYLDFGGPGRPLLALHGHVSEGHSFAAMAQALGPEWRVIAPDQRGHGDSDRTAEYSREGYLEDVVALLHHLDLGPIPVLGHSGGGITAYQLAARHPELVSALINEEGPAELPAGPSPLSFVLKMPWTAPTREELVTALGPLAPMVGHRLRELPYGGWRLPFHPADTVSSEEQVRGDHWADWLGSNCPALLVRGSKFPCLSEEQASAMADRRPDTRLVTLETDHFVHDADPAGFAAAVREFLRSL